MIKEHVFPRPWQLLPRTIWQAFPVNELLKLAIQLLNQQGKASKALAFQYPMWK
ncbi:MAG: hypothetical protein ACPGJS_06265 [Flammeovirgaceae bacterium]